MYNRIGLKSTKGQGSSGYIRANLANRKPIKSRLEFIKEMRRLKDIDLPANLKPNEEIIKHNQKRQIYSFLFDLKKKLRKEGKADSEVERVYSETEAALLERFEKNELEFGDNKKEKVDTHMKAKKKAEEEERVKKAFGIKKDYEIGNAFDFELQERIRLQRQYERELKEYEEMEKRQLEEEEERQRKEEETMKQDIKVEQIAEEKEMMVANILKYNGLDENGNEPEPVQIHEKEQETTIREFKEDVVPDKPDYIEPVRQVSVIEQAPEPKKQSPEKKQDRRRRERFRSPSISSDISSSEERRIRKRRSKRRRRKRSLNSSSSLSD